MSDKKLAICITAWNRPDMVIESFKAVHNDDRVSEIVINDDCSTNYNWLRMCRNAEPYSKVKLYRNNINMGVYDNKKLSVEKSTSEWVIVFDSDNKLSTKYLNSLYLEPWYTTRALAPAWARPSFDYRKFAGETISRGNIRPFIDLKRFDCLLNTMNYFCNRQSFLEVWEPAPGISGADSIHFNYLWLKSGKEIKVVDGLEYDHLVHGGSNYIVHAKESEPLCRNQLELIRRL